VKKIKGQETRKNIALLLLLFITILLVLILILMPEKPPAEDTISYETILPETTGPEITKPETVYPETTGPETIEPETVYPETTGPETTVPGESLNTTEKMASTVIEMRMAIVIDDVGHNLKELKPFLELSLPITFAILPHLTYSTEAALLIQEEGKEIILHMPMEPVGEYDPGPGAIYTNQDESTITKLLQEALNSIPQAVGINNHMGSKVTADEETVSVIMEYLKKNKLFFLDSLTTPDSVAEQKAKEKGVPFLKRSIFLDNVPEFETIKEQFNQGLSIAGTTGSAILIGHVQNQDVFLVLKEMEEELDSESVKIVTLTELLKSEMKE
jgi:polysaccharide deacetylase 2 family uncharacterized protein YibQ